MQNQKQCRTGKFLGSFAWDEMADEMCGTHSRYRYIWYKYVYNPAGLQRYNNGLYIYSVDRCEEKADRSVVVWIQKDVSRTSRHEGIQQDGDFGHRFFSLRSILFLYSTQYPSFKLIRVKA